MPPIFFNHTTPTEIYTLSLHDALPIYVAERSEPELARIRSERISFVFQSFNLRSEEHTSELQSHSDLVCRLLLEKKKVDPIRRSEGHLALFPEGTERRVVAGAGHFMPR